MGHTFSVDREPISSSVTFTNGIVPENAYTVSFKFTEENDIFTCNLWISSAKAGLHGTISNHILECQISETNGGIKIKELKNTIPHKTITWNYKKFTKLFNELYYGKLESNEHLMYILTTYMLNADIPTNQIVSPVAIKNELLKYSSIATRPANDLEMSSD
jgi:hypothetical protein